MKLFGKTFRKRLKAITRRTNMYAGRIIKVAAPVAGAIFLGPVGAAAGTAVGSFASYYGEKQGALAHHRHGARVKKAGRRGLRSGLIIGGSITGASIATAVVAGGSATSLGIFGGGSSSASSAGLLTSGATSASKMMTGRAGSSKTDSGGIYTQQDLQDDTGVQAVTGGQGTGGVPGMITRSSLDNASGDSARSGSDFFSKAYTTAGGLFRAIAGDQGHGSGVPPWVLAAAAAIAIAIIL